MTTAPQPYIQHQNILYVRQDPNGDVTDTTPLSNDAKLGIGFGVGFGVLVPSAVAGWLWFGKRKRRQRASSSGRATPASTAEKPAVADVDGGALEKQRVPACESHVQEKPLQTEKPARSAGGLGAQQAPPPKTRMHSKTRKESSSKRVKPSPTHVHSRIEDITMADDHSRFWPAMA